MANEPQYTMLTRLSNIVRQVSGWNLTSNNSFNSAMEQS